MLGARSGDVDFTGKPDPSTHRKGTSSEMWSCKPAKPVLDALFAVGELVIAGRVNFQRRYGYYVLPFLWRDRIVGRTDLKSESGVRARSSSRSHLEPAVRRSRALDEAFDRALDRLRHTAGLDRVCDENQPGEQLAAGFGYRHETSSGPSVAGLGSGP